MPRRLQARANRQILAAFESVAGSLRRQLSAQMHDASPFGAFISSVAKLCAPAA